MSDSVEHPSHYNAGNVETIDAIKSALGDAFLDYCRGNVLKYVWRCRHKGKLAEDLRKAARYLEWAIAEAESEKPREPQELAIPDGWRELEPGELPRAEDMVEHGSSWVLRGGDSAMECEWHEVRMIRKIEPSNPNEPEQLAIPDGWRWLNAGEVIRKGDTDKSMKPVTNWWIGEICRHSHDLLRRNKFEVGEMVVDCRTGWNLRVQLVDKEYPIVFVEGVTNGIEVDHLAPYIEGVWVEEADANASKIEPTETSDASIPHPGEGYRLLSKDPPEPVVNGVQFWDTSTKQWYDCKNVEGHESQAPSYYYRRKIEAAQ